MPACLICFVPIFALGSLVATGIAAERSLIENGDFEQWTKGLPNKWQVEVGARNGGDQPTSEVRRIAGPALLLRGDAKTMTWRSVTQEVRAAVGKTYRLEFDARSKDVKREGQQHDNCYVGWLSLDAAGKVVGHAIQNISANVANWKHFVVDYTIPRQANKTQVSIFLSKSGLLGVKNVTVTPTVRGKNLLSNGTLEHWTEKVPDGWTLEVSARNGANEPLSTVKRLGSAGVELTGDKATMAWYSMGQQIDVQPGKTYTLSFEAATSGIRREGRQYNNCYVGVMIYDEQGERLDMAVKDLSTEKAWKRQRLRFMPPAKAGKTEVLIFLSKTGSLKVKNLSVEEANPQRPFRGTD